MPILHGRQAPHNQPCRELCSTRRRNPPSRADRVKIDQQRRSQSERNLVVHVVALAGAGHGRLALARAAASGRSSRNRRRCPAAARRAAAAAAVEHGQRRVEALQHDLGRVFVVAVLVGPFAGLQRAFEINLRALLEILLDDLAQALVEDRRRGATRSFPCARRWSCRASFPRSRRCRLAIGRPSWVRRISGSLPRLPIRITLLTLPAMMLST